MGEAGVLIGREAEVRAIDAFLEAIARSLPGDSGIGRRSTVIS